MTEKRLSMHIIVHLAEQQRTGTTDLKENASLTYYQYGPQFFVSIFFLIIMARGLSSSVNVLLTYLHQPYSVCQVPEIFRLTKNNHLLPFIYFMSNLYFTFPEDDIYIQFCNYKELC